MEAIYFFSLLLTRADYCRFGEGERTLVVIPGMSLGKVTGSVELLRNQYALLCKDFTVYVFDRADDMPAGYTTEDMAEETVRAMQALGLGKSCVMGFSQGGMIAQYMAINHPELVDRLIIGSSAARISPETRHIVEGFIGMAETGRLAELTDGMLDRMFTAEILEKTGYKAFYRENPPTTEDVERFRIMAEAVLGFDAYDRLRNIQAPTLIIGVEGDEMVTGEASRELAEALGCELYMYEGYKHAVYDEAPDYLQHVYAFFTGKN